MKRTTFVLEDGILEGIRQEAHLRNCDMSLIVNEFLRAGLHRKLRDSDANAMPLPVFEMGPSRANLADRDALEHLMGES